MPCMLLSSNWKHIYRATNRDLNIDTKWYVCSNQTTFKVTMCVQTRSNLFKSAIRHMNLNSRFSPIQSQSARFRSFIVETKLVAILHFELEYASCKNNSYFLAVTDTRIFSRNVNFFLLKAIRRLKVVRKEAQQRFFSVEWEIVHRAQALFRFFK